MIRPAHSPIARAAAFVALLVMALGLPRLLMLCTHDGGPAHLEFAHSPAGCCSSHADEAETAPVDDHLGSSELGGSELGSSELGGHRRGNGGSCEHSSLAIELGTSRKWQLPRELADGGAQAGLLAWLQAIPAEVWACTAIPRLPPTTGPPRIDRRTERIVTTVLRC